MGASKLIGALTCLYKSAEAAATEDDVIAFLTKHSSPSEAEWHNWVEHEGFQLEQAYTALFNIAAKFARFATGGKSRGESHKVDDEQLRMGIKVEMEHTPDADVSEKIARDHLAEHDKYYTALEKMEDELKATE